MRRFLTALFFLAVTAAMRAADSGGEVVVVYNSRMPGSKGVADYYAARRNVPANQIFGFDLTTNETMSRAEYRDGLEKPLAAALEAGKLWHIGPSTNDDTGKVQEKVLQSKIRYAALCYGVPLRIAEDETIQEKITDTLRPELRGNGAAVDSELALLPDIKLHLPLAGPVGNRLYTVTNSAWFNPTNGILMVTRLDGPSASIARGLVDKAMEAESNGLCGRAYFDTRNLPTNSPYRMGDDWIMGAGKLCEYLAGYETVIDENPETFQADFPMSQIAIYCGWYDDKASGPFSRKTVEFMPGAFAYHLQSFSATTLRSATENWVGPLLAKGAAATMGTVDEPYLSGTPDVSVFCARWVLGGFTFGEAAYSSQKALSWQTTVVGDPLYRPFARPLARLLVEQNRTHSKWIEWSYLRLLNLYLARGDSAAQIAIAIRTLPVAKHSAVLLEKLGDMDTADGKPATAIEDYENALKAGPSPLQAVRIRLGLADKLIAAGRPKEALSDLKALLEDEPDYPDKAAILQRLVILANQIGDKDAAAAFQREMNP